LPTILGLTQSIGDVVSGILAILFLSIYWSLNQIHFERLWLSLLPSSQRKQARDIWRAIELDLGAYIRSEVTQSLLAALLLGVGYRLLGSPFPTLMALVGALAWLIPVVGAPLAIILPLLMGLFTSVQLSLITALYTLLVLFALEMWVEPRLFKRTWRDPILTLIIVLALADAFGLVGVLVAPPISSICHILWDALVGHPLDSKEKGEVEVSDLKERQTRLWETIKGLDEPPEALVTGSLERLNQLIEKAEPILEAGLPLKRDKPIQSPLPVGAKEGGPPG
jgi:predicted PurR-regulated permease PerM